MTFISKRLYLSCPAITNMLRKYFTYLLLFFALMIVAASNAQTAIVEFTDYRIENKLKVDTALLNLIKPYADSVNKTMNQVIGFSLNGLTKKQPESVLGNFMSDCMKTMAEKKFGCKVDIAFVNYGGIRYYIPKGEITVGKIFELMPFDNLIVLQELPGKILQQFLDKMAERDGWPVSGLRMAIKNKKAANVFINDKPLDENATYIVANTDYIANGGDDCEMLRGIGQINKGYLFRDALVEYIMFLSKQGKSIDTKTDNRIVYAN